MSEVVGEAVVNVRANTEGAREEAREAGKESGEGFGASFKENLKGLAEAVGLTLGVEKTVEFFKGSIESAREANKVAAVTAQVVKQTGAASGLTADQVTELAEAQARKTGVDRLAIQAGENLLLAYTSVRNEVGKGNDIFDRATKAGQDLAATGFGSITSNAKLFGKALSDPVKGVALLARAGVKLNAGQQANIKTLVGQNKTLAAQKIILDAVEHRVGGVAEKTATAGGKATVAFDEVKEAVGNRLLPVIDRLESFFAEKVVPVILGLLDGTGKLPAVFGDVETAAGTLVSIFGPLLVSAEGFAKSSLLPTLLAVGKAIANGIGPALIGLTNFLKDNETVVRAVAVGVAALVAALYAYKAAVAVSEAITKAFAAAQAALDAALDANPIGLIVLALIGLAAGLVYAYKHSEQFRAIVQSVFGFIRHTIPEAVGFVVDFVKKHWVLLVSIIGGPLVAIALLVVRHFGDIKSTVSRIVGDVIDFIRSHWKLIVGIIGGPLAAIVLLVVSNFGRIKSFVSTAIGTVQSVIRSGFGTLAGLAGKGLSAVVSTVAGLPGRLLSLVGSFVHAGASLIGGFVNGLKGAGGVVSDIAGNIASAFTSLINETIDRLNSALTFHIDKGPVHIGYTSHIPHLATGTRSFPGGVAYVGEQGPERVVLPRGSRVYNAGQTRALDAADLRTLTDALTHVLAGRPRDLPPITINAPTDDPEAIAMSLLNRLAFAS